MNWTSITDEPKLAGYEWFNPLADGRFMIRKIGRKGSYLLKQASPVSLSCSCNGFVYRGNCKHATYLQKHVRATRIPREWATQYVTILEQAFEKSYFDLYPAGSYLRGRDTVKDVDCVLAVPDVVGFVEAAAHVRNLLPGTFKPVIDPKLGRIIRGMLDGLLIDLYLCHPIELPAMLMFLTGPKEFNIFCRSLAKRKGLRLSQYGLFVGPTETRLCVGDGEHYIFEALGLSYLTPADREKFRKN